MANTSTMTNEGCYQDFAMLTEEEVSDLFERNGSQLPQQNDCFPSKLHFMLSEAERDPQADEVISWSSHGRSFIVKNQDRFTRELLPLWFRQSFYSSFQRQLNLYGFKRITRGPDSGAYYHECFLRGKLFLAAHIKRKKVNGTGTRQKSNPEGEPNLRSYPPLPPQTTPTATTGATATSTSHSSGSTSSVASVSESNTTSNLTLQGLPARFPVLGQEHEQPSLGALERSILNVLELQQQIASRAVLPPNQLGRLLGGGLPMAPLQEQRRAFTNALVQSLLACRSSPGVRMPAPWNTLSASASLQPPVQQQDPSRTSNVHALDQATLLALLFPYANGGGHQQQDPHGSTPPPG